MLLHIDSIAINLRDAVETEFCNWYDKNKEKTKELLLSGYFIVRNGISQYYEEYYRSCNEEEWRSQLQKKLDEALLSKNHTIHMLECQVKDYQQRLQNQHEEASNSKNHTVSILESQIKDYQQRLVSQQEENARIKNLYAQSFQDEVDRLKKHNADLEYKLKQSSIDYNNIKEDIEKTIKQQYDYQLALEQERLRSSHTQEIVCTKTQAEQYKSLYQCTMSDMQATLKAMYEEKLDQMSKRISEKDRELALLKKTNAAKGALGENLVASYLRSFFPAAEVYDTSKIKHSCDIHLKLEGKHVFAFESKYKDSITPNDIEKFYRDAEQMAMVEGENFLGAAFISLRTKNIPTKGDLYFDQVKSRPILFIGFESEEKIDHMLFSSIIKLFVMIGYYQKKNNQQASTVQDIIEKLKPILFTVSRTRSDIDNIKTMASKIIDSTINLDRDIGKSLDAMYTIVGVSNLAHPPVSASDGFNCPRCNKPYKSKTGLENHIRSCIVSER